MEQTLRYRLKPSITSPGNKKKKKISIRRIQRRLKLLSCLLKKKKEKKKPIGLFLICVCVCLRPGHRLIVFMRVLDGILWWKTAMDTLTLKQTTTTIKKNHERKTILYSIEVFF